MVFWPQIGTLHNVTSALPGAGRRAPRKSLFFWVVAQYFAAQTNITVEKIRYFKVLTICSLPTDARSTLPFEAKWAVAIGAGRLLQPFL